jgi:hypothetical protein
MFKQMFQNQTWLPDPLSWIIYNIQGRYNRLYDFGDVIRSLPVAGQHEAGMQVVDIKKIVGSVGRADDFDRQFHLRQGATFERWKEIANAVRSGNEMPPVELMKIGDLYFVIDGHHRISVMASLGQMFIDAHVIEVETRMDIQSTAQLRHVLAPDDVGAE